MQLCNVLAWLNVIHRDALSVHPVGEGMPCLVHERTHGITRAVQIDHDKRRFGKRQIQIDTSACVKEHHLVFCHVTKEFACLRGKRIKELLPFTYQIVIIPCGMRIAAFKKEFVVRIGHGVGAANPPGLLTLDGVSNGHYVFHHPLTKPRHVILCKGASQPAVFIVDVSVETHFLTDALAQTYELSENVVEGFRNLTPACAFGFVCGETTCAVFVLLQLTDLIVTDRFALKAELLNFELFVFLDQFCLPLQIRNDLRRLGFPVEFGVQKHHIAVLGCKFCPERRIEHRLCPGFAVPLKFRIEATPESALFLVKLIVLINVAAYERHSGHRFGDLLFFFPREKDQAGFLIIACVFQLPDQFS